MRIFAKSFLEENKKTEILNKNKEVSPNKLSQISCDEDEIMKIIDKAK
jgi:hypothetical protein